MFLSAIFFLFAIANANFYYQAVQSCVYNILQNFSSFSEIECAIKCQSTNCKAFLFDDKVSICSLYDYNEICQSNTMCRNVTIFINNKYNNMFHTDITNPRYQIFKNINYVYEGWSPSVYNIINETKADSIITDKKNDNIFVFGTYENSKLLAYPKEGIVTKLNKSYCPNIALAFNIVEFLTNGICQNCSTCYYSISEYKKHLGEKNLVFGIYHYDTFDTKELTNLVKVNNWHFIVGGVFWQIPVSKCIQDLVNLYGLCITENQGDSNYEVRENICTNITTYNSKPCALVN